MLARGEGWWDGGERQRPGTERFTFPDGTVFHGRQLTFAVSSDDGGPMACASHGGTPFGVLEHGMKRNAGRPVSPRSIAIISIMQIIFTLLPSCLHVSMCEKECKRILISSSPRNCLHLPETLKRVTRTPVCSCQCACPLLHAVS